MANIKSQYPHGMTDNEIKNQIKEYSDDVVTGFQPINTTLRQVSLIQLGQNELQGRSTKRVIIVSYISLFVSVASLFIAGLAFFFSYN